MRPLNRGILFPAELPRFERRAPEPAAAALVRWFWIAQWEVAPGGVSRQKLLPFHALNLAVQHDGVLLGGASTRRGHRDLTGRGWVVGALLRSAAVPRFCADPMALLDGEIGLAEPGLFDLIAGPLGATSPDVGEACRRFSEWMVDAVGRPSEEGLLANSLIERIEADPGIVRVEDAAATVGVSVRTAQRLTRRYVGLTPLAMIRRRRLQEAAEHVRTDPGCSLADVAAQFGYADQAHLARDFRDVLDFTPGQYRRSLAE